LLQRPLSVKTLLIALIVLLALWILGCGSINAAGSKLPAEQSFKAAKRNYSQFMTNSQDWGQRQLWKELIKEFDNLAQKYPRSKRADDALYLAAGLYSSLYNYSGLESDLQQAVKRYKKLLSNYKESHLADDALYNLGLISFKLNDRAGARANWLRLLKEYPDSDMRVRTKAKLEEVREKEIVIVTPIVRKKARIKKSQYKKRSTRRLKAKNGLAKKNHSHGKTRVLDLRHWSSPTYTRVVIDLDQETSFSKGILKDKHNSKKTKSIYLNLKNSIIPETSREIVINDGILQRVKIAQFNNHTVRAVIHVGEIDHYKIFALSNPPRIVIDVIGGNYKSAGRKGTKTRSNRINSGKTGTLSLAQQLGLGVGTIVIDAGHGGKDPGALSPGGGQEKKVVLDITRRLRKILKKRLKYEVITTRDTDRFIPLEERTGIANTKKADLFISIHANASRNRRVHGVATYFLNLSTDKQAMELAALENSTSTKNIGQLQSILNDLMQNSKIKESSRLAGCVQAALVKRLRISYRNVNNLGVKQAPFYVLIGAQMPSILVEVSFISNKMESQRLASPAYRQKIAEGVADGVQKYIDEIKLASM